MKLPFLALLNLALLGPALAASIRPLAPDCGYADFTQTFPLLFGKDQQTAGTTTITLEGGTATFTYTLDAACTLSGDLHATIVSTKLTSVKPGRLPCKARAGSGTLTCSLASFSFACCDSLLYAYAHADLSCNGGSETAYAGDPSCSLEPGARGGQWCNVATITPDCGQCGCSDGKCQPSIVCPNCGETVCSGAYCAIPTLCGICGPLTVCPAGTPKADICLKRTRCICGNLVCPGVDCAATTSC